MRWWSSCKTAVNASAWPRLGLQRAQEFSWPRVTAQYEAVYRKLGFAAAPVRSVIAV